MIGSDRLKHLYAACLDDEIVAVHDFKDVIEKFIDDNNEKNYKLLKLYRKKSSSFDELDDLYLMRLNDRYIQSKYLDDSLNVLEDSLYDLKYTRDVLLRLLEYREKGSKSIEKTILILEDEIRETEKELVSRPDVLSEIKNLNNKYKARL